MTVYIAPNNRKIQPVERDRFNDQVILTGSNESYLVTRGAFFIEYLEAESGKTVTIKDGNGTTIAAGMTDFSQDHSPIRCDYGVSVTGDLVMLKGFILRNVFEA